METTQAHNGEMVRYIEVKAKSLCFWINSWRANITSCRKTLLQLLYSSLTDKVNDTWTPYRQHLKHDPKFLTDVVLKIYLSEAATRSQG